jgi:hypothetical protein
MSKPTPESPRNERPQLLSDHLEWYIQDADQDASAEEKTARSTVDKLITVAMSSLEGFAPAAADQLLKFWRNSPDSWHWAVDDYYARQSVTDIAQIVRRFLKLTPVLVGRIPSDEVSVYLREATRTYIHGFFQASTALSRAALEAGINEHLKGKLGAVPNTDLIDIARLAHEVRKAGGNVLHKSPAPEKLAFDTLISARKILMNLYEK